MKKLVGPMIKSIETHVNSYLVYWQPSTLAVAASAEYSQDASAGVSGPTVCHWRGLSCRRAEMNLFKRSAKNRGAYG
jgi:hypothetical protein